MCARQTAGIYEALGVRRVINAAGSMTILGGSMLSPRVLAAMEEANESFVDMEELLTKSGQVIARILGAEAALVTSGCYAALVLGAAGIMTGTDPARIARLPDTTGMNNEFLIQKRMRYHYDRCVTVPGGQLVEVGDEQGTTPDQLERAIGPRTAGILYLARMEGDPGILPIPQVVSIAHRRGVAVLIDAAAEVYPLERMRWLCQSGADLVCFGAKYFGSTHSTGVLCGKKGAVEAATLNNFIAYETHDNHAIGRGYKVDRQEVVATVVALQEWFQMNHEERFAQQERRIHTILQALEGIPHITTQRLWERQGPWMRLMVTLNEQPLGKTAVAVQQALRQGNPSIRIRAEGNNLLIAVHTLREGEDAIVAQHLRAALSP
ncbi:MAG: aminotransferase class V-fold PLP-dependent enzyme [Dehalococcoidia bacterium]|nr:aminotransferase class V-fold PLP-dependent enzyme [Dehalococcoidia bacterium]MDW8119362.1 aminotransferase class V-fold PLP-dependent enzyme [Chloroflexota bacterium]